MFVKFKKLFKDAIKPTRGSEGAAGWDLYAHGLGDGIERDEIYIPPNGTVMIGTGIAMEIPKGYFGAQYARSGLATKLGLSLINGVGVIDSDYRGELKVPLHNFTGSNVTVKKGERVAQLVIQPYLANASFVETDELDDTKRGTGGFGSTGRK